MLWRVFCVRSVRAPAAICVVSYSCAVDDQSGLAGYNLDKVTVSKPPIQKVSVMSVAAVGCLHLVGNLKREIVCINLRLFITLLEYC